MDKACEQFLERVEASLRDGGFLRLTLSRPLQAEAGDRPERILCRRVSLRAGEHLQQVQRYARRDVTANLPLEQVADWLRGELPRFGSAFLGTRGRDWQLSRKGAGSWIVISHKAADPGPAATAHDEPSGRLLDPRRAPWLQALGVTDPEGRVRERMGDKFRQIARYIELLDDRMDALGLDPAEPVRVVDMGSGKGYLTFATWHLLTCLRGQSAKVVGFEERPELVELTERIAREHRCDGLSFRRGRIAEAPVADAQVVLALHACDTATDDALLRGVRAGARLILAAPCCHRQLRPQIDRARSRGELAPLLAHGILRERFSEWLTDGLRALHLEAAGYETQVLEFVPSEHTPKNLLLAGIRRDGPAPEGVVERIRSLRQHFGIHVHALDALLPPAGNSAERR